MQLLDGMSLSGGDQSRHSRTISLVRKWPLRPRAQLGSILQAVTVGRKVAGGMQIQRYMEHELGPEVLSKAQIAWHDEHSLGLGAFA